MLVKRYGAGTVLALAATVVLWSTTFAGLSAALEHFSPGHLLFLRWTLTATAFIVFALLTRMRLPAPGDAVRIVLSGLFGFGLYQILLVNGQTGVSATMAGFLINMSPVFTTVLAVALGHERSAWSTWAGLALCTIGLVVMGGKGDVFGGIGSSGGLIILAALSFTTYTFVSKPLLARYRPIEVTTYAVVTGTLPLLVFAPGSLAAMRGADVAGVATLVYLALVPGAIAYVLWAKSLKGLPPGVAARSLYLIPVLGMFVAWAWVGETSHAATILGGLVVLAGVALAGSRAVATPKRTAESLLGAPGVALAEES